MHTNDNRKALLFRVLLLSNLVFLAPAVANAASVGSSASQVTRIGTGVTYTVKTNDTLWDIAVAFDVSIDALTAANPSLDPKRLQKGQVLVVPGTQPAAAPTDGGTTYTVSPNDTLWDIATAHGIAVDALTVANPGIDPQRLQNGQVLIIPGAGEAAPAPSSTPYTVQPNDTLWTIATSFDVSVESLTAANPNADPKLLRIGQVLQVPGIHVMPAPAAAPAAADPPVEAAPPAEQPPAETPPAEAQPAEQPPAEAAPPAEAQPVEQPAAEAAPPAEPQPAESPAPQLAPAGMPAEFVEAASQLLAQMNEKRVANGLAPYVWSAELAAAAQAHANDCAARNKGSHVGSDGARLATRLERAGYPARTSSENWANSRTIANAFSMWWNEPPGADPHRRNILWSRYTEIGIGIAKGGWGYYVIADFGSR